MAKGLVMVAAVVVLLLVTPGFPAAAAVLLPVLLGDDDGAAVLGSKVTWTPTDTSALIGPPCLPCGVCFCCCAAPVVELAPAAAGTCEGAGCDGEDDDGDDCCAAVVKLEVLSIPAMGLLVLLLPLLLGFEALLELVLVGLPCSPDRPLLDNPSVLLLLATEAQSDKELWKEVADDTEVAERGLVSESATDSAGTALTGGGRGRVGGLSTGDAARGEDFDPAAAGAGAGAADDDDAVAPACMP
jgi:hypothetical protein